MSDDVLGPCEACGSDDEPRGLYGSGRVACHDGAACLERQRPVILVDRPHVEKGRVLASMPLADPKASSEAPPPRKIDAIEVLDFIDAWLKQQTRLHKWGVSYEVPEHDFKVTLQIERKT